MTPLSRRTIFIALIICMAPPAWSQQYLYTPQPAPPGQKAAAQDGILVQELEIRKGDTLYSLSRTYSGRGIYFPQILLFNSIKNPNLIYAGDILKVPVTQEEAVGSDSTVSKPAGRAHKPKASGGKKAPAKARTEKQAQVHQPAVSSPVSSPSTELSLSDLKTGGAEKNRVSRVKKNVAVHAKKNPSHLLQAAAPASSPSSAVHKSAGAAVPAGGAAAGQKLFEAAVKAYRQDDCRTALELLDRYLADNSGSPLAADANLYKAECYLKLSAQ